MQPREIVQTIVRFIMGLYFYLSEPGFAGLVDLQDWEFEPTTLLFKGTFIF